MSEIKYHDLRKVALSLNSRMLDDHPCRSGNGACCKLTNVSVTMGDAAIILNGLRSGEISEDVLDAASKRAKDPANEYCAFFDQESSRCTIYDHRPLVCVEYGMGGAAKITPDLIADVLRSVRFGEKINIEEPNMSWFNVCLNCVRQVIDSGKVTSLADILDHQLIATYIRSEASTSACMSDLVQVLETSDLFKKTIT